MQRQRESSTREHAPILPLPRTGPHSLDYAGPYLRQSTNNLKLHAGDVRVQKSWGPRRHRMRQSERPSSWYINPKVFRHRHQCATPQRISRSQRATSFAPHSQLHLTTVEVPLFLFLLHRPCQDNTYPDLSQPSKKKQLKRKPSTQPTNSSTASLGFPPRSKAPQEHITSLHLRSSYAHPLKKARIHRLLLFSTSPRRIYALSQRQLPGRRHPRSQPPVLASRNACASPQPVLR